MIVVVPERTPAGVVLFLGVVVLVSAVPTGAAQPAVGAQADRSVDYRIGSVSELDYYNSRGFEDRNGDGRVVLRITGTLNMSESRDPTLRYGGNKPFVVVGPGGFTSAPAPLVTGVPSDSRLVLDSVSITDVRADEQADDVISVGSPVTLDNVSIRDTIHEARYPTDTFAETHRVSVLRAGGDVTVTDTEIVGTGQAISTSGAVEIESSQIRNVESEGNGAVQAGGRAVVRESLVANVSGARGGAVNANGVELRDTTLRTVRAGFSGGAINTGRGATIVDSTIRDAHAGRNGGAVAAEGRVVVRESTIVDADADQDSSLYAYGARLTLANVTLRDADAVSFGKGGISYGSITVRDSELIDTSKLHASTIRVERSTVEGSLSLYGQSFTVRESTFEGAGPMDGSTVTVANSTLRGVPKIQASREIRVRDSMLLSFGGFRSVHDLGLTLENVTLYEPGKNVIPRTESRTLRRVNVIEAEPPVFVGTLPNKENVFVDTNNDSEALNEWDADVFWSRTFPFPAAADIPIEEEPTPTATATPTETATATATAAPDSPTPVDTTVDTPEPEPNNDPQNDRGPGGPGGELPVSLPMLFVVAAGSVAVGVFFLLFAVVSS